MATEFLVEARPAARVWCAWSTAASAAARSGTRPSRAPAPAGARRWPACACTWSTSAGRAASSILVGGPCRAPARRPGRRCSDALGLPDAAEGDRVASRRRGRARTSPAPWSSPARGQMILRLERPAPGLGWSARAGPAGPPTGSCAPSCSVTTRAEVAERERGRVGGLDGRSVVVAGLARQHHVGHAAVHQHPRLHRLDLAPAGGLDRRRRRWRARPAAPGA